MARNPGLYSSFLRTFFIKINIQTKFQDNRAEIVASRAYTRFFYDLT